MSSATPSLAPSRRAISTLIAFAAVATAASMFAITPYRYGAADHVLTIPFLKQWIDPTLYPNDYIVGEKAHLYTALWPVLGYFLRSTGVPIETAFLAGYSASLLATFLALGMLTRELSSSTSAGLLAMFLAVFAKHELAGSATIEDLFLTRVVALPIALFGFTAVVRDRFFLAGALLGVAFLVHPLTGIYAGGMGALVGTIGILRGRWPEILPGTAAFLAISSPLLVWKALDPVTLPFLADPEWLALLHLRAPHHVAAFTWSPKLYIATAGLVGVVAACASAFDSRRGRLLVALSVAALAVCMVEVPFGELLPLSSVVQLQLFRASVFIMFFAIVAYAGALLGVARLLLPASALATLWLMGFVVLYEAEGWPFALVALALLIAAMAVHRRVYDRAMAPETLALVLVAVVSGLGIGASRTNPSMSAANAQPLAWLEVQRWARAQTPKDAVFIVPPGHDGFRIESERSIYGDWKDGTQAFFNAEVGRVWYSRMQKLGYRSEMAVRGLSGMDVLDNAYSRLDRAQLFEIARELAPASVYVVDFVGASRAVDPPAYQNEKYAVFDLTEAVATND